MVALERATLAIRVACSGPVHPETLRALDALITTHPHAIDLQFARACLLEDLGRATAAERAYADILAAEPTHRGALINAATMLYVDGRTTAALRLYRRAAAAHPNDVVAHVDLAHALADSGALGQSRVSYERALSIEPAHAIAHYALGRLLAERGDPAAADHRARAFARPIIDVTASSNPDPLRVLVPTAADGGNLVTTLFFDNASVETTTIVAESSSSARALPPHDLIFNGVADADRSADALEAVERIVAASGRPCINPPAAVRATGRVAMARRLALVPGVVVPRTAAFARATLSAGALSAAGFTFPVLLRAPGFHAGRYFVRAISPDDAIAQSAALPGEMIIAIDFIDTRRDDRRFWKYRMLVVDGALVPLHLAVAPTWKVHYFSADNITRPASRAAEAAFLRDPRGHLGDAACAALERVRDTLALDYGGIDFALDREGNVVVFEANASFAVYFPDDDATAPYRRPVVENAIRAVRDMIRSRALRGRELVRENGPLDDRKDFRPP